MTTVSSDPTLSGDALEVGATADGNERNGSALRTPSKVSNPVVRLLRSTFGRLVMLLRASGRRLLGPSTNTSLRRIPLFVGLASMAVVGPLLMRAYHKDFQARTNLTWAYVRSEAQNRMSAAEAMLRGGPKVDDPLMYLVRPKEPSSEVLGKSDYDIEPPLFKLAEGANFELQDRKWFSQQDRPFAPFVRQYDENTTVVALVNMEWLGPQNEGLRSGLFRWTLLGIAAIGLLTALVAHLLLRPARRILRERTDFLADAAHELRTPLSVIQASAGHALARPREGADYIQALAEIRSAAERASTGVTEMLDLARFDAGQAMPRLAPLRLDLLAEELASSVRIDGCDVAADTGPNVLVQADMALIRQAIDNIVRNAASRASIVRLQCSTDGSDGVIKVIDNGPGFADEQLPYVFERYRRGDSNGSLGLGLPIAASIVAAHGGRVDVTSPSELVIETTADHAVQSGRGAVVTLRIPRSR